MSGLLAAAGVKPGTLLSDDLIADRRAGVVREEEVPSTRRSASVQAILDAAAVVAFLNREPRHEAMTDALAAGAGICTANVAEVIGVPMVASRQRKQARPWRICQSRSSMSIWTWRCVPG